MHDLHLGENAELHALGLLDATESRALEAHILQCDACLRRVGEAEETVLALERGIRPVPPRPTLDRRMHFVRSRFDARVWAAIAAAFIIGLLPSAIGLLRPGAPSHEAATVAMIESHFRHAQFAGSGPAAKVVYAENRAWLYVLVHDDRRFDVYGIRYGKAVYLGSTRPHALTSELFVARPGTFNALQLREGQRVVDTAALR